MKTKNLKIFTFIIYFLVLLLIFVLIGCIYLSSGTEKVDQKAYSEPYEYTPQNCGIFIDLPFGKSFYYLDFKENEIKSFFTEASVAVGGKCCGYRVDYIIKGEDLLLKKIVDAVGGTDLTKDGVIMHFSGDMALSEIESAVNKQEILKNIAESAFKSIAQNGIKRDDIIGFLEYAETNLTVPDFYYWPDFLKLMAANYKNKQ